MPIGKDPLTSQPPSSPMAEGMIEVEIADLRDWAQALQSQGRLSNQAYMAIVVGLGCLKEAYRNPALRNVGNDLEVTVGSGGKPHVSSR